MGRRTCDTGSGIKSGDQRPATCCRQQGAQPEGGAAREGNDGAGFRIHLTEAFMFDLDLFATSGTSPTQRYTLQTVRIRLAC